LKEPIKRIFGSVNYGVSIHVDSNVFSRDLISVITFYLRNKKIGAEGCRTIYDLGQKLKKFWKKVSTHPQMEINDRKIAGWLEDYFNEIDLQKVDFRKILKAIGEPYTPVDEKGPKILPSYKIEHKVQGLEDNEFFKALEAIESLETTDEEELTLEQEKAEKKSLYDEIIAILRENEGKISLKLIQRMVNITDEELTRAIEELKQSGEITEPEPGKILLLKRVLIEEEGFYLGPIIYET
jgi:DNA segregation ATPase FtsK/SpoIIIE-like protein